MILLSLDKYPQDKETTELIEDLNVCFYVLFLFEMIFKLIGDGFVMYFKDGFNRFDAFLVLTTSLDLILLKWFVVIKTENEGASSSYSALRAFRLFRVFKLAKSWEKLNKLMEKIFVTLRDIRSFLLLLLMFMVTFTLLGMELFAYRVVFNEED